MIRSRAAAPLVALALAACMAPATVVTPGPAAEAPSAGSAQPDDMTAEVARLVNAHRIRIGCPALQWDAAAASAAQSHSEDMARRDYFSHASPEGTDPGARLRAAGANWRAVAENIAAGPRSAEEVVRGWLASPGHRQNIERCIYTRHGVGYAAGRWTHVFYTPP